MAQEIADSTLLDTWGSSGLKVEPDISKIIEGWQLGEQPPHEYMNWLQNTFGSKLNHILKNGIIKWNDETEYLAGSSVQHNSNVWICKNTNTNSEPTDLNANWEKVAISKDLTVTVNTITDLRSISYPAATVWASGYHTKNDGAFGSHIFRLKGDKTTETDNGGTVIVATIGGIDYVYELQFTGAVNVKWFGANTTRVDNEIPIQMAIDLYQEIDFGAGEKYKISGNITATSKTIHGNSARLIVSSNITALTTYQCHISDLTIDRTNSEYTVMDWKDNVNSSTGMDIRGYIDTYTNINIRGFKYGIVFNGVRTKFTQCFIQRNMTGIVFEKMDGTSAPSTTVSIDSCNIDYNMVGVDCIEDSSGIDITYKIIGLSINNQTVIQGNYYYGIRLPNMFNSSIDSTWFESNGNGTTLLFEDHYNLHNGLDYGALLITEFYNPPTNCRFSLNANDTIFVDMSADASRISRGSSILATNKLELKGIVNNFVGQEDSLLSFNIKPQGTSATNSINDNILIIDRHTVPKEPFVLLKSSANTGNKDFTNISTLMYNNFKSALTGDPFSTIDVTVSVLGTGNYLFTLSSKFNGMVFCNARSKSQGWAGGVVATKHTIKISDNGTTTVGNQFNRIEVQVLDSTGVAINGIVYLMFVGNELTAGGY